MFINVQDTGQQPQTALFCYPMLPRDDKLILRKTEMAKALTVKTLENLRPTGARQEVPDGLLAPILMSFSLRLVSEWPFKIVIF